MDSWITDATIDNVREDVYSLLERHQSKDHMIDLLWQQTDEQWQIDAVEGLRDHLDKISLHLTDSAYQELLKESLVKVEEGLRSGEISRGDDNYIEISDHLAINKDPHHITWFEDNILWSYQGKSYMTEREMFEHVCNLYQEKRNEV